MLNGNKKQAYPFPTSWRQMRDEGYPKKTLHQFHKDPKPELTETFSQIGSSEELIKYLEAEIDLLRGENKVLKVEINERESRIRSIQLKHDIAKQLYDSQQNDLERERERTESERRWAKQIEDKFLTLTHSFDSYRSRHWVKTEENKDCPICMEEMSEVYVGRCDHAICYECYGQLRKHCCPLCRMVY